MRSRQTRSVTLEIAGERLSLRTDRDDAFLYGLADYMTAQVDEIRGSAKGVSIQQVYLLVALKLADELHQERTNAAALYDEVTSRANRVIEMVDAELQASSSSS